MLNSLADAPGIDQRQLAERVAIDLKKTRRIVRRLQQLGLIELPTSAQKAESLTLTEAGLQVREKLLATVIAVEGHLMATLSETEREVSRNIAAEIPADRLDVDRLAFVGERSIAGDNEAVADL